MLKSNLELLSVRMSSYPSSPWGQPLSAMRSVWTFWLTVSCQPPPPYTWRHCYTSVNLLNTSLRAICIVANGILLEKRNNWVLKGIMSVTATLWRFLLNCHWLTCGCCSVLSILFFPFWTICKACCKDLPFCRIDFSLFFYFIFYFVR